MRIVARCGQDAPPPHSKQAVYSQCKSAGRLLDVGIICGILLAIFTFPSGKRAKSVHSNGRLDADC